jgi:hypothetical protein
VSSVGYETPLEALQALVAAMELQAGLAGDQLELLKQHGELLRDHDRRVDELEEAWASATLELGRLTRRCRLVLNMKAATLTLTCLHCGNDYAREAGVQLCGPCWVELGKPERYLRPAEPA